MTFGQEMSAYASLFKREAENISELADKCTVLPLGGTAVGTGEGTVTGYTDELYKELTDMTGCEIRQNENLFDAFQNADLYVKISAELKILAAGISKMSKDLRLLGSGPRAGIGELVIPSVLPGSSIMPGKINPILPELMIQVYFLTAGNDLAVTMAAEEGELDLNVWEAVFIKCLFESCRLLTKTIPLFADKCIAGLEVNEKKCLEYAQGSTALAAIISAVFGYEQGSVIARKASEEGKTVLEAVTEKGLLDPESAAELLDPKNMAKDPVIFACANPTPEIFPDEAKEAGAAVISTGRSDFPNQINNVLAFPGIFRGTFDVRASEINDEMKIAAAEALAGLISEDELSADYIIPKAFDPRVGPAVAAAVAEAARKSGVARI